MIKKSTKSQINSTNRFKVLKCVKSSDKIKRNKRKMLINNYFKLVCPQYLDEQRLIY